MSSLNLTAKDIFEPCHAKTGLGFLVLSYSKHRHTFFWLQAQNRIMLSLGKPVEQGKIVTGKNHKYTEIHEYCKIFMHSKKFLSTLFSKRSAHENHSNFLRSLGHRPWPRVIFLNGVFCTLLSMPFDKINMTLGQGQWPRVTGRTGRNQCALLLEKSVPYIEKQNRQ